MKKIILGLIFLLVVSVCASATCATSDVDNMAADDSAVPQDMFISVDVGDHDYNLMYLANQNAGDLNDTATSDGLNNTAISDYGFKPVCNVPDGLNDTAISDYGFKPVISAKLVDDSKSSLPTLIASNVNDENVNSSLSNNITDKPKCNLNIIGPKNPYDFLNPKGPDYKPLFDALHNITGPRTSDKTALLYQRAYRFAAVFIQHPEWGIMDCLEYVAKFHSNENVIAAVVADAHNIALRNYIGKTKMAINEDLGAYEVYTYILWYWSL